MLKYQQKDFIRRGADYSLCRTELGPNSEIKFVDLITRLDHKTYSEKYLHDSILAVSDQHFVESGFHKLCVFPQESKANFKKQIFLFFPYFRSEAPTWLNQDSSVKIISRLDLYGKDSSNIIKVDVVRETEQWLLDVVLDQQIYEKKVQPFQLAHISIDQFIGYEGKNTRLLGHLNAFITKFLQLKDTTIKFARIGVSAKGNRRVSIMLNRDGEGDTEGAPTLRHLSSGEMMMLSIFSSILREYDLHNDEAPVSLSNITGVVLIDEFDLHLHISAQTKILPLIISSFPKIQFIVSTHSPFFLQSLDDFFPNSCQLIELPSGRSIQTSDFSEFRFAYDSFIAENDRYLYALKNTQKRIGDLSVPLVITEGKTDWKHILNSFLRFDKEEGLEPLNLKFLEYEEYEMGDTTLLDMCKHFSKFPNQAKIIFLFDRDNPSIVQKVTTDNNRKNWGNNVYSICIPTPEHRTNYKNISIEMYYEDSDLVLPDPDSGRRLVFSNEIEIILLKSATTGDTQKIVRLRNESIALEELDKKIYATDCDEIVGLKGEKVAISKNHFAENICSKKINLEIGRIASFKKIYNALGEILAI